MRRKQAEEFPELQKFALPSCFLPTTTTTTVGNTRCRAHGVRSPAVIAEQEYTGWARVCVRACEYVCFFLLCGGKQFLLLRMFSQCNHSHPHPLSLISLQLCTAASTAKVLSEG